MATKPATETQVNDTTGKTVQLPDVHTLAMQEALAFTAGLKAKYAEASGIKSLALDYLAKLHGESCSVAGRPGKDAANAFFGAIAAANVDLKRRMELVNKAISAQKAVYLADKENGGHGMANLDKFKPCAVQSAKANDQSGYGKYRFNLPMATEIAIG